jgi:DNA mismatch repair protein MSH6
MSSSKAKGTGDMKQKSLISFFSKDQADGSKKQKPIPKTPAKQGKETITSATPVTPASSSSAADVFEMCDPVPSSEPPTPSSDPIDVDMVSDDDKPKAQPKVKKSVSKRKVIDSDDETSFPATPAGSSPGLISLKRTSKKPRLTPADDEEEAGGMSSSSAASSRFGRFRNLPSNNRRSKSRASDDDDFIVPDSDSESDVKSVKSNSRYASSRTSSAYGNESDDLDLDLGDSPVKKKSTKRSQVPKKTHAVASQRDNGGGDEFLTAAEKRTQNKKDEKKAAEDPYEFLNEIKDKDGNKPGDPKYDQRSLFIPKKAWATFTPFEKQFWEIKQNHYDTVLFFQKGKFYELYEDDARIGHREFDLKLTSRVKMSMVRQPFSRGTTSDIL